MKINPKDYTCKTCRHRGKTDGIGVCIGHHCNNPKSEYYSGFCLTGFDVYCQEWETDGSVKALRKNLSIRKNGKGDFND